ncbi:YafY family transcriptional regulator [Frankia sp. AgPm24]|uniref:helix-turn-helix transcriptional regulator n=1 Tax=Frankia sp. AgPm24 TaxID=631128 RepID=UPI00200E302B|nr:YafY family protein [Frankia sp. AgPm24]MCK9923469.1 YafY family transcriptional regulator [Frankia sp. AgPm24]
MADPSARMLRLLSLLQTHRHWPGDLLAARLEVSARTLRRDVDRLRELGYPVEASRGVAGGYQLQAGTAMPPLLLDDEEAVAVAVGLRTAAAGAVGGVGGVGETSVRALAKVVALLPPRLRSRVDAVTAFTVPAPPSGPTVDVTTLTALASACRAEEEVSFAYTDRAGATSRRRAEPYRLVALGGRWYLLARDVDRDDWRTFRVDRVQAVTGGGRRFRPRELPDVDAAAYVRRGVAGGASRHRVVVRVRAPASQVGRVIGGWGRTEVIDADSCLLRMDDVALEWATMLLGVVGAPFSVVDPPELVDQIRVIAEVLARAAAAGPPATTGTSRGGSVTEDPRSGGPRGNH